MACINTVVRFLWFKICYWLFIFLKTIIIIIYFFKWYFIFKLLILSYFNILTTEVLNTQFLKINSLSLLLIIILVWLIFIHFKITIIDFRIFKVRKENFRYNIFSTILILLLNTVYLKGSQTFIKCYDASMTWRWSSCLIFILGFNFFFFIVFTR